MSIFLKLLFLILVIIVLLLVIVLFTKVTVVGKFQKKKGEKSTYSLDLMFFGGLIKKDLLSIKQKHSKKHDDTKNQDDLKFFDKVKKNYKKFLDFKKAYSKNSRKIRRAICAEKIYLNVDFGVGDAAKTGIATGGVWAGIYNVISFVASIIRITEPKINVNPLYNELKCEIDSECVIKSRPVNLLIAVAGFGITYLKLKKNKKEK